MKPYFEEGGITIYHGDCRELLSQVPPGRAVNGGDVAYVFGVPPGSGIIGGQAPDSGEKALFQKHHGRNRSSKTYSEAQERAPHPAPRKLAHVKWLMVRFGHGLVLDPFAGSGTTLLAAKDCGLQAIGIEIEERHCELAAKRLKQGVLGLQEVSA